MSEGEEYLDVEQVRQLLGVSRATVWNIISRYQLQRYQIPARGRKTLVKKSELLEALSKPVPIQPRTERRPRRGKAAA